MKRAMYVDGLALLCMIVGSVLIMVWYTQYKTNASDKTKKPPQAMLYNVGIVALLAGLITNIVLFIGIMMKKKNISSPRFVLAGR